MYIGIDLGSTNIKAAIYDKEFHLVDRQSRPVNYIRDYGFVEFDAWVYYQDLIGLLADMVKANGVTHVDEIAFTGQAESLVILDRQGERSATRGERLLGGGVLGKGLRAECGEEVLPHEVELLLHVA